MSKLDPSILKMLKEHGLSDEDIKGLLERLQVALGSPRHHRDGILMMPISREDVLAAAKEMQRMGLALAHATRQLARHRPRIDLEPWQQLPKGTNTCRTQRLKATSVRRRQNKNPYHRR